MLGHVLEAGLLKDCCFTSWHN